MRFWLSGFAFCLLLTSTAFAQGNTLDWGRGGGPAAEREAYYSQVRTDLNNLLIRWKRAFESDDASALARFYAEDANYHPANVAQLATRSSIQQYFNTHLRSVADVETQLMGFGTSGDMAYVTARVTQYTQTSTGSIKPVVSIDMFVFRRQNGRIWQIESQLSQLQAQDQQLP